MLKVRIACFVSAFLVVTCPFPVPPMGLALVFLLSYNCSEEEILSRSIWFYTPWRSRGLIIVLLLFLFLFVTAATRLFYTPSSFISI
ncbi:hypothetical protein F4820DRAFT_320897 [Hypoxylon rubiginosum]|uniref:Uncharacterized protein n=1 Tax=Hypoxylon rubiginosum TaxID=110542 RepID=A0ACB9ZFS0_9PEZI|nr:hypothetical protein F4820DRAFT_320897 [Hypoxylon rubiginosum]